MPTSRQIVAHLECLNEARANAKNLLKRIDRCMKQADRWIGQRPRSNGNGAKKSGAK